MPIIKTFSNVETTGDGLAKMLGITRRWVYQLVNEGVIKKDENNKFNVEESVKRYCEYLRSGTTEKKTDTQAQYWQEKAKHEASRREIASINLGKIKGDLLETKDVELALGGMLTVFKRQILALPHKMAGILVGKKQQEIGRLLADEIKRSLTELSQYDASKFGSGGGIIDDSEDD